MADLYLGSYVVIPYPANWRERPKLNYVLSTAIAEKTPGAEKRGVMYAKIRASIEWLVTGLDGEMSGRIEETLRIAQAAKKAAVPNWLSERSIVSISGNVLTLSAAPDPALEAGQTIWWGQYEGAFGLATVRSVSGANVTLDSVPDGLAAGHHIAPLILGRVDDDPSVEEIDGAAREWTIKLVETSGNLSGATRTVEDALAVALEMAGMEFSEIVDDDEEQEDGGVASLGFSGVMTQTVFDAGVFGDADGDGAGVSIGMSGVMTRIAFLIDTNLSTMSASLGFSGVMS
jgi:hypothetical protein